MRSLVARWVWSEVSCGSVVVDTLLVSTLSHEGIRVVNPGSSSGKSGESGEFGSMYASRGWGCCGRDWAATRLLCACALTAACAMDGARRGVQVVSFFLAHREQGTALSHLAFPSTQFWQALSVGLPSCLWMWLGKWKLQAGGRLLTFWHSS